MRKIGQICPFLAFLAPKYNGNQNFDDDMRFSDPADLGGHGDIDQYLSMGE